MVPLGEIADVTSSKRTLVGEFVQTGIPFNRTKEVVELRKGGSLSMNLFISYERFDSNRSESGAPYKGDILIKGISSYRVSAQSEQAEESPTWANFSSRMGICCG